MAQDYQQILTDCILDPKIFVSATFSGRRRNHEVTWQKVTLRPVLIKDQHHVQVAYFDGRQDVRKNYTDAAIAKIVADLLQEGYDNFFVRTTLEDIQVRISKKGKIMMHRAENQVETVDRSHDRVKLFILPEGRPDPFLQASGIMNQDGSVKANKRAKFVQINQFLQFVADMDVPRHIEQRPLHILDCGCGSAYLTFAAHHYLNHIVNVPTQTVGVDLNQGLLEGHQATVAEMGWDNINFVVSTIIDYQPNVSPDVVLALHACDTATDEALAQAIWAGAKFIFSVPCCHHHLQAQLSAGGQVGLFEPLMRHNIVRERMGDLLTDSLRALILNIMGYQAQIIEFVSPEHTAKNLMIRAIKTHAPGAALSIQEYLALKAYWGLTPYLERLLGEPFQALIQG